MDVGIDRGDKPENSAEEPKKRMSIPGRLVITAEGVVPVIRSAPLLDGINLIRQISARDVAAAAVLAERYRALLEDDEIVSGTPALADRRVIHRNSRVAVIADDADNPSEATLVAASDAPHGLIGDGHVLETPRPLAFVRLIPIGGVGVGV